MNYTDKLTTATVAGRPAAIGAVDGRDRGGRRRWPAPALVVGVLSAALVTVGQAHAATPTNCQQTGKSVNCSFDVTDSEQTLAVPTGVSSLNIVAVGAPGGSGGSSGGLGATATASLGVTPGSTLFVEVGDVGGNGNESQATGGYNGGGPGEGDLPGGGGGGASDVRTVSCGTYQVCFSGGNSASLASRLLVAGGGGGGGDYGTYAPGPAGSGGAADSAGGTGSPDYVNDTGGGGGAAGTTTAGGDGGSAGVSANNGANGSAGGSGALGQGGDGGSSQAGGGGGGGGFYGGGGGGSSAGPGGSNGEYLYAAGGGGGGGASYVPAGGTVTSDTTGTPSVTISYTAPAASATTTSVSSSVNPALATQPVTFTAAVTPAPDGGTVAFEDGTAVIGGCGAQPVSNSGSAVCQTASLAVGSHQITAVYSGDSSYQGSSSTPLTEIVKPDNAQNLANLTLQYVQASAKFQALPANQQKAIDALVSQATTYLGQITPHLTPAQTTKLIAAYKQGVAALANSGWLTATQASTLTSLATNIQT